MVRAQGTAGGAIKPVCLTPDVPLVALAQTIVVWNLRNAFDRLARIDGGGGGVGGFAGRQQSSHHGEEPERR